MCNLGEALELYGVEKGEQKAIVTIIKNLKETMNWTTQQAMDAMKIPKEERPKYEALV